MDGSQLPRLKGEDGMSVDKTEVGEDIEIPTPDAMMGAMEDEKPEDDGDEDVKGVMLSMSRLAAKPIKKEDLKKKGKKVK